MNSIVLSTKNFDEQKSFGNSISLPSPNQFAERKRNGENQSEDGSRGKLGTEGEDYEPVVEEEDP